MAKRCGNVHDFLHCNKKSKVDELWGDDFDDDALDECFQMITQVIQTEQEPSTTQLTANQTVLPSYSSAFRTPNQFFASTQLDDNSSKANNTIDKHNINKAPQMHQQLSTLQKELQMVKQKLTEKDGETSILRQQINDLKINHMSEKNKQYEKKTATISSLKTQVKSLHTELEFKDLEVVNLKQNISKFRQMERCPSSEVSTSSKRRYMCLQQPQLSTEMKSHSFSLLTNTIDKIESSNYSKTNVPTCQPTTCCNLEQFTKDDTKESSWLHFKGPIDCLSMLLDHDNHTGLDSGLQNSFAANKVIGTSLHLLRELYLYLQLMETECTVHDVQKADAIYVKNIVLHDPNYNLRDDDCGVKAGQYVRRIAELLPFSKDLQHCLISRDYSSENMPVDNASNDNTDYWNVLCNIVGLIGKIRMSQRFTYFLCACVRLMIRVFSCSIHHHRHKTMALLLKEILFSRPHMHIVYSIAFLLKISSQHQDFLALLVFKVNTFVTTKTLRKNGIFVVHKDESAMYMFLLLIDRYISKVAMVKVPYYLCFNIITLVYNLLNLDCDWLGDIRLKDCRTHLYKLTICIISLIVKKCRISTKISKIYRLLVDYSLKVIQLLTFTSPEFIENYVTMFAQYQNIVNSCLHIDCDNSALQRHKYNGFDEGVNVDDITLKEKVLIEKGEMFFK